MASNVNQTEKPSWLSRLMQEMNELRRDMVASQRSLVRIEAAVLEMNDQPRSRPSSLNRLAPTQPITINRRISAPSTGPVPSNNARRPSNGPATSNGSTRPPRGSVPSYGSVSQVNGVARPPNGQVRPSSVNLTRSQRLVQDLANRPAPPRPCWYHRQFGTATSNCLKPCNFVPPVVPAVPVVPAAPVIPPAVMPNPPAVVAPIVPAKPILPIPEPMEEFAEDLANLSDSDSD